MEMQEENLAKGMHDGEVLWVCDLRYRDYADKPIRHIKPTKVLVRSNKKLEGKKKIYYSDSHFVAFGKGEAVRVLLSESMDELDVDNQNNKLRIHEKEWISLPL